MAAIRIAVCTSTVPISQNIWRLVTRNSVHLAGFSDRTAKAVSTKIPSAIHEGGDGKTNHVGPSKRSSVEKHSLRKSIQACMRGETWRVWVCSVCTDNVGI